MKQSWRIIAVTLLLVTGSTRCSTMDGPAAAARINFLEWAGNIRTPYRNESFQTIENDGTLATVRITVELKIKGEWQEKQTELSCEQVDQNWQCGRSFLFE